MDELGTDELRAFATKWSLAGDDKLLTILQNTHQKILSKSQEVNSKLEEMVAGLDNASISLQNVNNKFMALSNSQFIESRVYDDDDDITADSKPIKEPPKPPSAESELAMIKRSLAVLESMHEVVTILPDSDSDTDSDDDTLDRVVMKPKDLYADRPLPYIIGSQAWKNKWHAGLIVEDSESDSSTSKPGRESEQYSDSEPEPDARLDGNIQTDTLHLPDNTISETSSDLASEQDVLTPVAPALKPSPSDVAAELARRLAGQMPKVVEQERVLPDEVAKPTVRTVYRPHQPTPGTIFSDEPPPIDKYESSSTEEDDDIFAELHKKQPYKQSSTDNSRITDDLFDFNKNHQADIFSDFATNKVPIPSVKPKSTLYEDEPEPELFTPKSELRPLKNNPSTECETGAIKKPVGGISLFGSNQGAESIGAAILKRNQRKSSSNDESDTDAPLKPQTKTDTTPKVPTKTIETAKPEIKVAQTIKEPVKKEKDIFDDLFAKSEKLQKKETVDKDKKVDLFSDNLFDDIDDIFTSNIVKTKSKTDKPIFDDDDDLFADIAVTKTSNVKQKESKGLFDSDDDLFSEKPKIPKNSEEIASKICNISEDKVKVANVFEGDKLRSNVIIAKEESTEIIPEHKSSKEVPKPSKSIFDDDSSDNDIFSSLKTPEPKPAKLPEKERPDSGIKEKNNSVTNKTKETSENNNVVEITKKTEPSKVIKETKSIFDDDSDSDIFANVKATPKNNTDTSESKSILATDQTKYNSNTSKNENESHFKATDKIMNYNEKLPFNSPSLFDDDDEELFAKSKETITVNKKVTIDVVKVDSASNVLKTSHIVKETVITQENNKQTDISNTKTEETPTIVETIDTHNDPIPKSNKTVIEKVIDTPKMIEIVEEPPPFDIQTKLQPAHEELEAEVREPDIFNDNKPAPDPVNNKENTISAAEKDTVVTKPDIFSDIFTEPPAFEKLKEPKGSQNVNALFGDDSDDEALFFKKDDVISDDKPDLFVPNVNTDMFGIFVDEPPAIDVDFVTKSDQNDGIFDSSDDLFQSTAIPQEIVNKKDISIPKAMETQIEKNKELPKSIFEDSSSEIDKIDGAQAIDNDNKKVGKLKTMNFKIDVNALLPGGSPKKKLVEQVDGQAVSISNEELPTNDDKVESKMVKSVSFEGKPDSEVLDNKLSKERAKIQVKRRPSTRRARREAVRKSVMDIDNDSTDNSSSIDDLPKSRTVIDAHENKPLNVDKTGNDDLTKTKHVKSKVDSTDNSSSIDDLPKSRTVIDAIEKKPVLNVDKNENDDLTKAKDVKSKVVYILNDEDIFDTKPATKQTTVVEPPILDEVDSIKSDKNEGSIRTLGNVYKETITATTESSKSNVKLKETQPVKPKSSLFGDLSEDDDELFSKNKATVKKTNIFESDSDDDLFTGKSNKRKTETVERKTEVVKGSLFGDDDDDDLFGVKTKKISEAIPQTSKSTTSREPTKSTEPVFNDPLSMLEDDD